VDGSGERWTIRPVWSTTGGTIDTSGSFTAPGNGSYQVVLKRFGDDIADTATVTVGDGTTVTPPPTSDVRAGFTIVVSPDSVSLAPGRTTRFAAVGVADGKQYSVRIDWSATGGSITSSGDYTAPSAAGRYTVIGTRTGDTLADTSTVVVTSGGVTADPAPPESDPAPAPSPTPSGTTSLSVVPEQPRVWLNTAWVAPGAGRRDVAAGGDLQAALNAASCGSEVVLAAGATFRGHFVLPAKSCGFAQPVLVRSNTTLPAEGQRMTPALAGSLAKLVSPDDQPALQAATGASGYRVVGVEITVDPAVALNYSLVTLGNGETSLSALPGELIFDRVYIHGNPSQEVRRGITLNSRATAIIDSYITDIHQMAADNQAICGWAGPGPYKIVNNFLAAAGQNLMFGGGDPAIANVSPADIEIRRNHFFKPLSWQTAGWWVKNVVEFKHALRVVVEGNVLENHWLKNQNGFAVVMFSVNQYKTAPWTVVQDVTWRSNVLRNVPAGFNLAATNSGDGEIGVPANKILLTNNLLERVGEAAVGGVGRFIQVLGDNYGINDLTIEHNTAVFSTASGTSRTGLVVFAGAKGQRFTLRDNVAERGDYGVIRVEDVGGGGTAGLNNSMTSWQMLGNVVAGPSDGVAYPASNSYPASVGAVGFTNAAAGDYSLGSSSPYRGTATDGRDPGYDRASLLSAIQGAVVP
jgi:hypothetical protein